MFRLTCIVIATLHSRGSAARHRCEIEGAGNGDGLLGRVVRTSAVADMILPTETGSDRVLRLDLDSTMLHF